VSIDTKKSSKSSFEKAVGGSLKAIGFNGSVSSIYDGLATAKLKLVQLFVEEEAMKRAANDSPKALDNLRSYGGDARIAHQLFVVVEATLAESFTFGTRYEVTADALGTISVKASGGNVIKEKDVVTLSPGTGLAYLLLKVDWDKDKSKIESTRVDEWSVN